jgi:hypothetical protein
MRPIFCLLAVLILASTLSGRADAHDATVSMTNGTSGELMIEDYEGGFVRRSCFEKSGKSRHIAFPAGSTFTFDGDYAGEMLTVMSADRNHNICHVSRRPLGAH